jgi:hypothetical protein
MASRREPLTQSARNLVPIPHPQRALTIVPVEQRSRWYRIETPAQGWVFATSLRRDCAPSVL